MNRLALCALGLAGSWLAGCASAPQAEDAQAAADLAGGEVTDVAMLSNRELLPNLVVDAHQENPGSVVHCRDMLQHASNTIVRRCMSLDAWKRYRQAEAQRAQAILRSWQGSPYAGW